MRWLVGALGREEIMVKLTRSETWINDDFDNIHNVLDETIKDFVGEDERIINIEVKTSESGLSRFWIYTTKAY